MQRWHAVLHLGFVMAAGSRLNSSSPIHLGVLTLHA